MVKSVIILALLTTLFFLVKYSQPVAVPVAGPVKVAKSKQEKPPVEAKDDESGGFNPAVVTPLPDVNTGYVFSEKRKFEKDDPANAAKAALAEQGPDPLTTVFYAGSVIAGDLRRALVTYQELSRETGPRRSVPGRGQAVAVQGGVLKKQLNKGDRFLGYVVAAVEPDRLVFEKGDLKVEKFLYDQSKKRQSPPAATPRQALPAEIGGVPLEAIAPPEVLAAMMAPPATGRDSQEPRAGGAARAVVTPAVETGTAKAPAPPAPVLRRSQRLLGMDSLLNLPVAPVPGLPVPNN